MPAVSITDLCQRTGEFPTLIGGGRSTRLLDVWMDGSDYYPGQVKDAVHAWGIARGELHPTDGLYANNFRPTQQSDDRRHWHVEVEYGITVPEEGDDPDAPDPQFRDPLLDPPDIDWGSKQREIVFEKDVNGTAVLNYAKRPYDPPLTDWLPVCVLRVAKNEASATFATVGQYIGKVNSATWLGAPARHVICSSVQARKERRAYRADNSSPLVTISYWRVTYEFEYIDEDPSDDADIGPWDKYILQADFEQLNASGDGTEPIAVDADGELDPNGEPVRTPWPIGTDGRAIIKSALPAGVVYRGHQAKKTKDFNDLGITL